VSDCYSHLGEVAGVAVLSEYHTRDAAEFARRHDVPVTVPTGLDRVADKLDAPTRRVGEERLALPVLLRLAPPRERFADIVPERVLLGHGAGVFADAAAALEDAVENARRRFPRALVTSGPQELKALLGALG